MTNKQRSIVLVCYQIDNNMRLWRFAKQSSSGPGIGEGNTNLDTFLFGWYEHGSLTDDLLDNNIYITYKDVDVRSDFGPIAALTIDDLFDGKYIDDNHLKLSDFNSADELEKFFIEHPGFLKGLKMESLNKLVTNIYKISDDKTIKDPLPNEPWIERSISMSMVHLSGLYVHHDTFPILNEERTKIVKLECY